MSLSTAIGLINNVEQVFSTLKKNTAKQAEVNNDVSISKLDLNQKLCYDIAWIEAELFTAKEMVDYARKYNTNSNSIEEKLTLYFIADVLGDIRNRFIEHIHNTSYSIIDFFHKIDITSYNEFILKYTNEEFAGTIVSQIINTGSYGDYGLNSEQTMMMESFRSFGEDNVIPIAERIHRTDETIPNEIINPLAEMGCFGLSIPDIYGGFQSESNPDHTSIAVVTEELSRCSLGVAGSLITRPEIVSKAILKGGTQAQKEKWLPLLASGKKFSAVAVTEPDYGSDVAAMKVTATKVDNGWLINGTKTWCTFAGKADVLLVLARTSPDMSLKHKGLSILLAEKPTTDKHEFDYTQPNGGRITGKAISTIGYRGMHSYEVSFQDYLVPHENLIGEDEGLGKGFYLQMAGFAGGRFQTAARVAGVMQAAMEKALSYAQERKVFATPIINYGLTKSKIARMASITQAVRQGTYKSARLLDNHEGQMEASLIKFYSCKMSEWVTREAMQIHGGMGYAEEYAVSRYFVDARVFSIFEGVEEVLALRVIAKTLLSDALEKKS